MLFDTHNIARFYSRELLTTQSDVYTVIYCVDICREMSAKQTMQRNVELTVVLACEFAINAKFLQSRLCIRNASVQCTHTVQKESCGF